MNWKRYEAEIFQHFKEEYPDASVSYDAHLQGRFSKVERQIDVLINGSIAGFKFRIAVDAKFRGRSIDVTEVESFIGLCNDIGAQKGVLISLHGFTPAAINRAYNDLSDLELDVLNFSDLKQFQGFSAIPYAGGFAVVIGAPFGWILDGTRRNGVVATLYQRGYDFEEAAKVNEWMYINFWIKDKETPSLEKLLELQENQLLKDFPKSEITYRECLDRTDAKIKIRTFICPDYPTPEHTGFIEFAEFIFFCVLFSPEELLARNMRKLEYLLKTALPIKVRQVEKV